MERINSDLKSVNEYGVEVLTQREPKVGQSMKVEKYESIVSKSDLTK